MKIEIKLTLEIDCDTGREKKIESLETGLDAWKNGLL